jgi:hypothetical protein
MKIAFACALGYSSKSTSGLARVRRDIEDFVHHNRFGAKDIIWSGSRR